MYTPSLKSNTRSSTPERRDSGEAEEKGEELDPWRLEEVGDLSLNKSINFDFLDLLVLQITPVTLKAGEPTLESVAKRVERVGWVRHGMEILEILMACGMPTKSLG